MANLSIRVENDRGKNVKVFGNVDTAVEYCQARLHENFTVYVEGGYQYEREIEKTKARLVSNLRNVRVV